MPKVGIIVLAAMTLCAGGAFAQNIAGSEASIDKPHVFTQADVDGLYEKLEARSPASCAEGSTPCKGSPGTPMIRAGTQLTLFARVVRNSDLPRVLPTFELWFVQAGTATSVAGGKLINPKPDPDGGLETQGTGIEGGAETQVKAGDIVYIPPSMPHTFKNIKGFRAVLVRAVNTMGKVGCGSSGTDCPHPLAAR